MKLTYMSVCQSVGLLVGLFIGCSVIIFMDRMEVSLPCDPCELLFTIILGIFTFINTR